MGSIVDDIVTRLFSPDSLSVVLYIAGVYCIATAFGIATGVQVGKLSLPSPATRTAKTLMIVVGISLASIGLFRSLQYPEYKPVVFERWIYQGDDVKQIVADGETVYLLKENGNIYTISQGEVSLVDPGTNTRQITPSGRALYILKDNGNIWVYQPNFKERSFQIKDPGIGTAQIEAPGETLYVLKENGNIWKSVNSPLAGNMPDSDEGFIRIDKRTQTKQISSSGSILYILKENGNIWKFAPTLGQPFEEIYQGGDAEWIEADGGALYFVANETPCQYRRSFPSNGDGEDKKCDAIDKKISAKKIDALGGIVYILTKENKIFRYNADADTTREMIEAGSDNWDIAAYYQDLFVIKTDSGVKRYNEGRLKR